MAIQLRRGNEADLDISRLQPGECAVCLDSGKFIVKLSGGNYLTLTDMPALREIVDGKAASVHTHSLSEITGLAEALAGKASTAVAVASVSGSGGSAGLMSPPDKEKLDNINIVLLTQEQYEALDPPDSNTLYLIPEASS